MAPEYYYNPIPNNSHTKLHLQFTFGKRYSLFSRVGKKGFKRLLRSRWLETNLWRECK